MFRSFRSLFVILQILAFVTPLMGKGRRQKLSFLLKEGTFFALTNWELIWKLLEQRKLSFEALRNLWQVRKR